MNMKEDCMNHIHLTNDVIIGDYKWKGKLELLNIIMVGVAGKISDKDENNELHRLLGTLLSEKLKVDEKLDILENEYDIPMEESIEEEVKTMCNLSEGIEERAMEAGRKAGIEEGRKTGLELGNKSKTYYKCVEYSILPMEALCNHQEIWQPVLRWKAYVR